MNHEELHGGVILVNRFQITLRLASGGYGNIWQAKDLDENRFVAIKILKQDAGNNDPHALVRMRQEAEMLSEIPHPNIVKIFGYFSSPYGEFIAMELLRGFSLDQLIEAKGIATDDQAIRLVSQMLSVFSACHAKGVIHRDLKPDNIILVENENGTRDAKLVDFGIAKATDILTNNDDGVTLVQTLQGGFMGTPRYAAPELVVGDPFGPNIDLYSFGLVVAEWLTGRKRMNAKSHGDVMSQVLNPNPISVLDCPPRWREWLSLMIARDPKLRFQTAQEAEDAFRERVLTFHLPADFVEPAFQHDISQEVQNFTYDLQLDSGVLNTQPRKVRRVTDVPKDLPPIEEFFGKDKPKWDMRLVIMGVVMLVLLIFIAAMIIL